MLLAPPVDTWEQQQQQRFQQRRTGLESVAAHSGADGVGGPPHGRQQVDVGEHSAFFDAVDMGRPESGPAPVFHASGNDVARLEMSVEETSVARVKHEHFRSANLCERSDEAWAKKVLRRCNHQQKPASQRETDVEGDGMDEGEEAVEDEGGETEVEGDEEGEAEEVDEDAEEDDDNDEEEDDGEIDEEGKDCLVDEEDEEDDESEGGDGEAEALGVAEANDDGWKSKAGQGRSLGLEDEHRRKLLLRAFSDGGAQVAKSVRTFDVCMTCCSSTGSFGGCGHVDRVCSGRGRDGSVFSPLLQGGDAHEHQGHGKQSGGGAASPTSVCDCGRASAPGGSPYMSPAVSPTHAAASPPLDFCSGGPVASPRSNRGLGGSSLSSAGAAGSGSSGGGGGNSWGGDGGAGAVVGGAAAGSPARPSRAARAAAAAARAKARVLLLADDVSKYASMAVRVRSGVWMVLGFAAVVWLGHVFIAGLVLCLQLLMAHELFGLAARAQGKAAARRQQQQQQLQQQQQQQQLQHKEQQGQPHPQPQPPHVASLGWLNWYFLVTAVVYVYGSFMQKQLALAFTTDASSAAQPLLSHIFLNFIRYHPIICYSMYIAGFVCFILSLKSGQYKQQFGQFAWTHMILLVVLVQSSFFVANIFQGIIWFLLPCSLIIINDCSAYAFGFFFGRTPLIALSPKKTWEGFLGASVATVGAAFVLAGIMGQSEWLTCPRKDLGLGPLHCKPDPLFQSQPHPTPHWLRLAVHSDTIWVSPLQQHALVLGMFASSIAPFGGFFASGFKRAFKIKDFGEMIPGHGGITDRMDCQIVMAVFSYIYYQSFIAPRTATVEATLSQVMGMLEVDQVKEVYVRLGNYLLSEGVNISDLHTSDPQSWS